MIISLVRLFSQCVEQIGDDLDEDDPDRIRDPKKRLLRAFIDNPLLLE